MIDNFCNELNENFDIRKSMIKLFNSREYHELKLYYNSKSIFDILGIMRNENVHSNFLAWLLDPSEYHGLNYYTIKKFLEMLIMALFDCKYSKENEKIFPEYLVDYIITGNYEVLNVEIEREKVIENNKRIDIYIDVTIKIYDEEEMVKNLKIILENKVYSKEHSEQTLQYYKWAKKKFNGLSELIFVYLTPISNNELYDLNEQQCKCKEYIQVNYQYIVDYLLEPCRMQQLPTEAQSLINNYFRCLSYPSLDEKTMKQGGIVMAINDKERKLLLDFWEGNKPLLLAMLNVLKDDDNINKEEKENIDNMINTIYTKSGKDYSKCLFKGKKYAKSRVVWEVLNEYINTKKMTFEQLKNDFKDEIQGSSGVVQSVEYVKNKDPRRFYMKPSEILTTSDNIEIAVCNQWGVENIDRFIKVANSLGLEVTRVETNN